MRKMFANAKPDMELEALECNADGEPVQIHQRVKTPIKNRELTFRIGEPFEEKTPNGKTVRVRPHPHAHIVHVGYHFPETTCSRP